MKGTTKKYISQCGGDRPLILPDATFTPSLGKYLAENLTQCFARTLEREYLTRANVGHYYHAT